MLRQYGFCASAVAVLLFGAVPGVASAGDAPLPAGVKAVWDLTLRRDPVFLGPHETGVDKALGN